MRASDRVYDELREEILSWRLAPGTALSETELAERLGVSRTPLRAALARLAIEGLIDTSRGRTGVVSEVSSEGIRDLFELREALEVQAVRLAARRRDGRVFAALSSEFAIEREKVASDLSGYYDVVDRFDEAVDAAVANPALRGALDSARTHLARARRVSADNPERLRRAAEEHAAICAAIRDGDDELAASLTIVHLRASLSTILATLPSRASREGIR